MPLSDFDCLAALDSLELRSTLPNGCDTATLAAEGLIEPAADGAWRLTVKGQLMLVNLRSLERRRQVT